jgi:hypothetical protein
MPRSGKGKGGAKHLMSGFSVMAKSLISQTVEPSKNSTSEKLDHIKLMAKEGFSPSDIFRDLRELYDACEDDEKSIKLQISKLMIQVQGLLTPDDIQRAAPSFQIVIQGDGARVNTMLCPQR